jgi:hypothetical protein
MTKTKGIMTVVVITSLCCHDHDDDDQCHAPCTTTILGQGQLRHDDENLLHLDVRDSSEN